VKTRVCVPREDTCVCVWT